MAKRTLKETYFSRAARSVFVSALLLCKGVRFLKIASFEADRQIY